MPNMIKIWPWEQAPKKYKKLSKLGGDEDWVVYIPGEYKNQVDVSQWIQAIDTMGEPIEVMLENGDYVYIGGHA